MRYLYDLQDQAQSILNGSSCGSATYCHQGEEVCSTCKIFLSVVCMKSPLLVQNQMQSFQRLFRQLFAEPWTFKQGKILQYVPDKTKKQTNKKHHHTLLRISITDSSAISFSLPKVFHSLGSGGIYLQIIVSSSSASCPSPSFSSSGGCKHILTLLPSIL